MRLQFSDVIFDSEGRTLQRAGRDVKISGKAFQLLHILLERRPDPVAKEELYQRLWPDTFVSEANLASLIKEIRSALDDDARDPRFIKTAHRFGYSFAAPVTEAPREQKAIDSVAVLPFADPFESVDGGYLGDGLAEGLINFLAAIPGVRVAPRSSSFRFRGREGELEALRRELNVRALVTGRLRTHGNELTLQVELIDLARQAQVWGEQFRSALTEPNRLHEPLAREVAERLRVPLSGDTSRRLSQRYTSSPAAYQQYLVGRHHWNRRTLEGLERAIVNFQSAIESDPKFAPAYSGLADSYIALASRDLSIPAQLFPKADAAARKALELDPELAEAHASIGAINEVFEWNWSAAREAFLEALRLNPNYQTARLWYADALAHQAEFGEAIVQVEIARDADPLSVMVNSQVAKIHYLAGDYEVAERAIATALEVNPYHEPTHFTRGLVLLQKGDRDGAAAELDRALTISKGEPHVVAALGHLESVRGDVGQAAQRLQRLQELSVTRHVSPVHPAMIHIGLGELDRAFEELNRACELRSGWLVYLASEPRFAPLRDDARYRELVERVGLARGPN
jgi:uncharacterized protein (TIGR02996 family)